MGYVLGADVLIDLLKAGDEILSQEALWSLEQISGHRWGREIDHWEAWWDRLPEAALPIDDATDLAHVPVAS